MLAGETDAPSRDGTLASNGRAAARQAGRRRAGQCWSGSSRSAGRRRGCVRRMSTASSAPRMPANTLAGTLRRADLPRRLVRAGARRRAGPALDACLARHRPRPAPPRHRAAEPRAGALPALPRPGDGAQDPRLPRPGPARGLRLAARASRSRTSPPTCSSSSWSRPATGRRPRRGLRAPAGLLTAPRIGDASTAGRFCLRERRGPAPARRPACAGCAEGVAREGHGGQLRRRALGADAPHPAGLRRASSSSMSGSSRPPTRRSGRCATIRSATSPGRTRRRCSGSVAELRRHRPRRAAGSRGHHRGGAGVPGAGGGQARRRQPHDLDRTRSPTPSGCRSRAGWRGRSPTSG